MVGCLLTLVQQMWHTLLMVGRLVHSYAGMYSHPRINLAVLLPQMSVSCGPAKQTSALATDTHTNLHAYRRKQSQHVESSLHLW